MENVVPCNYIKKITTTKRTDLAIFISGKINLKPRGLIKMNKISSPGGYNNVNVYAPNNITSKFMKQKPGNLKGEIYKVKKLELLTLLL